MLTGRRAFDESSVTETLAAILHKEPDWSQLPARTPPAIRRLLRRSLCKDPARRLRDIGDAALEMDEPADSETGTVESSTVRSGTWRLATLTMAGLVFVGAAGVWRAWPSRSAPVSKLILGWPAGEEPANRPLALAPDGSAVAYLGQDGRLWIREFGRLEPRALAGTERASAPFFSPDGRSVAFVTTDGALKVTPVGDVSVQTIVADSVSLSGGGAWSPEGIVYFSRTAGGVERVPATGGPVEPVSRPETAGVTHRWVDLLPGGKAALVSIVNESVNTAQIGVLRLDTGGVQPLFPGAMARFASTGHVLYVTSAGTLRAVPFDPERLQSVGPDVPVIENVDVDLYSGSAKFAVSQNGTLVYQLPHRQETELVWVTKGGVATPLAPDPWTAPFFSLSLSPDGKRLAATVTAGTRQDVWTRSLETGALNRLTLERDGTLNYRPRWTADGKSVTYISNRSGKAGELWRQAADGSAPAERLVADGPIIDEGAISPDGVWAVYRAGGSDLQSRDIKALRLGPGADAVPKSLVATKAEEYSPAVSPDSRWLAYVSQESGRAEVYVRPFPEPQRAVWQISRGGGAGPVWARDGLHLFYVNERGELVEVAVPRSAAFERGPGRVLFEISGYEMNNWHPAYDVSPDGRFLMARRSERARVEMVVIFNWFDELKGKLRGQ
jgi:serine/threonine-protein kinase